MGELPVHLSYNKSTGLELTSGIAAICYMMPFAFAAIPSLHFECYCPFYLTAVVPLPRKQVDTSKKAIREIMRGKAENLTEKISIVAAILNFAFSTL